MSQTDLYLFSGITLGATTICLAGALLFDRLRLRSLEPAVRFARDEIARVFALLAVMGMGLLVGEVVALLVELVSLWGQL